MTGHRPLRPSMLGAVALGGALGALARYALTTAFPDAGAGFPWTTFAINVTGSLLLALLPAVPAVRRHPHLPPLLGTGVLGGYTTMSAYAEQSRALLDAGHAATAAVYVVAGAAVGAPLRYVLGHLFDDVLPWGTIAVNVVGSFLLGLFSGLALGGDAMALLGVGFCGALTTYSSFAVQTHDRGVRLGAANVLLTVVPALAACFLGFLLGA